MKQILLFAILSITILSVQGQKQKSPTLDIKAFNEKFEQVRWLCEYDRVAWVTSDSVMKEDKTEMARLGSEWFCFQAQDSLWHAVYGKYAAGRFDQVFHYIVGHDGLVKRVKSQVDTALVNTHSRGLIVANQALQPIKANTSIRFNQFIKRNPDNTLSVWMLPAFQTNGVAVYGGEFYYQISPEGTRILTKQEYYQGQFRGFKTDTPRDISLGYEDVEQPTWGSIFFVWYYKSYFTKIFIENKAIRSTAFRNENKSYSWFHVELPPTKKSKGR
ncbi:hypothetical protein [Hymenobacter guriensis]|uniref:Uncharacterized protein n=1 Tax=Hymenobacter guriensis TaxID=2793065 RepID=A0ABS0L2G2_9BACT|nr:hypothetical protein [Hymenobacter guriensis]MBG8554307.1 hypothetical protein [Hymenobacter guriensis]